MEHWEVVHNHLTISSDSPEDLWDAAAKYFYWCDINPITAKKPIISGNKAGTQVNYEQRRPYSIKGLCIHCNITEEYLQDIRNSKNKDSDYWHVVSKIIYLIWLNNFEGAMVGEFNPIFTAKVLNMDKEEAPSGTITIIHEQGLPRLAESENEILENLESDKLIWENTKEKNL